MAESTLTQNRWTITRKTSVSAEMALRLENVFGVSWICS